MLRLFETKKQKLERIAGEKADMLIMQAGAKAMTGRVLLSAAGDKAIETFGKNKQLWVAAEEMSELTRALSRNNRGEDNTDNIAEEIADVEIMLYQLKKIFRCEKDADRWRDKKLVALLQRVREHPDGQTIKNAAGELASRDNEEGE